MIDLKSSFFSNLISVYKPTHACPPQIRESESYGKTVRLGRSVPTVGWGTGE